MIKKATGRLRSSVSVDFRGAFTALTADRLPQVFPYASAADRWACKVEDIVQIRPVEPVSA